MTFVGKILVIVIMAFAILFLGISTVVFSTHTNWKLATDAEKKKVQELTTKNTTLQAALETATKDQAKAAADHKAAIDQSTAEVKKLQDDIAQLQAETTKAQSGLESAIQRATVALNEAEARRKETDLLRDQKRDVEKQANEFKIQQTDLNDQIRELQRQLKTLDDNNKSLRDRVARFSSLLQKNGIAADITTVTGLETPPPVEGQVARVDSSNRRIEITIGSDDGLSPGHELYVYRTSPRAEYLGKVKITTVDPDQAVARVIGNTVNGKKIQEGDIVSSTIKPRS